MNPNTATHASRTYEPSVAGWPGAALLTAAVVLGIVSLLYQLLL